MSKLTVCGQWPRGLALLMFCVLVSRGQGADSDIIINEIMYHPVHCQPNLQYIELFNRGDTEVDLSNWAFIKGIEFVFPAGTRMAAGAYLIVCRNRAEFTAKYGGEMLVMGDFSGHLSHHGEKIELANGQQKVIDAVKYLDHEPWPMGAAGRSPSLERICPHAASDAPENWASSKYGSARYPGGTPGRQNDSYSTNLPPAVSNVSYAPPAPRPEEPVTVSAAITDAEGVKRANLLYRVVRAGTSSEETAVQMRRIAGDELRGNYEAIIPGQPQGALVRFRIKAVDKAGAERLQPSESEPRPSYSYCRPSRAWEDRSRRGPRPAPREAMAPSSTRRPGAGRSRRSTTSGSCRARPDSRFISKPIIR